MRKMREAVYLNGSLVSKKEAKVSVFDWGYLYGFGLFETMRVYWGGVFRLDEHLNRLISCSDLIKFPLSYSLRDLRRAVYRLIETNKVKDGSLRVYVSKAEKGKQNLVITSNNRVAYPQELYRKGLKAKVVRVRQNEFSLLCRVKAMNYLNNILARLEAECFGCDEAILLNTRGFLAEGSRSNIFIIDSQGRLLTPSIKCGILPGITRGVVLQLASRLGMKVSCRKIHLSELKEAKETFLTNSLMEVMPLVKVDSRGIGKGRPGPITKDILKAYRTLVRKELSIV